jgi:2-methylcitrate dehydratase PrpD
MSRRLLLGGAAALPAAFAQSTEGAGKAPVSAVALASVVNRISFPKLPPAAVTNAKMILASTLASAAAGTTIGSARIVRDLAKEQGGQPEAVLWFDGARLPAAAAARANAMLSDASASDDSDLRNVAHIGTCLTAVGLAVGDRVGVSGPALLAAMVAGYEAAGRISEALLASSPSSGPGGAVSGSVGRGFHASSIVAFGGTAAAGKLLGLTEERMAHAFGITATTMGGLSIGTNSWAREYHAGNAALCAVNAVLAAGRGYTVNDDMLEAAGGFLSVFGGGKPETASLVRESGDGYQITKYLAVKLVPGAHALHPAVEAAINAAREGHVAPDDVVRILVAGPQSGLAARNRAPKDMIEAIHSLPYYIASAVADKDFTWANAEPRMIQRPAVARLMGLVEQDPSPSPVRYEWNWGATVTIVSRSGARFTSTVDAPRGSAPRGIEWSDVEAKFRGLMPTSHVPSSRIEEIWRLVRGFEQAAKTSQLTDLLG